MNFFCIQILFSVKFIIFIDFLRLFSSQSANHSFFLLPLYTVWGFQAKSVKKKNRREDNIFLFQNLIEKHSFFHF